MKMFNIMSIFQKCDVNSNTLCKTQVYNTIPPFSTKYKQKQKRETHTEWRWRFFNIYNKKYVEISKKEPNKKRVFIDLEGKWSNCCIDDCFKQYIAETYYCYLSTVSEDEKNCQ